MENEKVYLCTKCLAVKAATKYRGVYHQQYCYVCGRWMDLTNNPVEVVKETGKRNEAEQRKFDALQLKALRGLHKLQENIGKRQIGKLDKLLCESSMTELETLITSVYAINTIIGLEKTNG